ncbi:MAG: glucose 1-dehydrogenase [Clostridiales bacterium]|nr:glucose 1-dehydrogenase [Clostridiales bacterium]
MENQVVLITGAANGIGAAMAKLFALNNYKVIINYNNSEVNAKNLVKDLSYVKFEPYACKADVQNEDEIKNMIKDIINNFGHIDILINNAGIASSNLLIDENLDSIQKVINTNLVGTINCTKHVCKHMISQGYGKIINISSIWGKYGACMESIYSASKGGIITFTKAMAKELASANITVNCIAPGIVETNMMNVYSLEEKNELKEQIPLNRFAKPEEIANLALFLASEKADYITGQTIIIDGGFTL